MKKCKKSWLVACVCQNYEVSYFSFVICQQVDNNVV